MLRFKIFLAFITFLNFSASEALNNPQLMSHDGHLKFQAADGKNITFTNINGDILFNGLSIRNLLSPPTPERSRPMNRRNILTLVRQGTSTLRQQVSRLEQSLEQLKQDLEEDECQSQPCRHGAQCFDGFKKYQCKCTDEWTGQNCEEDVNECVSLHNTDKGCQNGATCVNTPGSFRCLCQPHFYGKLCSERVDNCMNASNAALCDHGTCINQNPTHENGAHYKCICDPGWKSEDGNPSCSKDVDECTASSHPCDPLSKCQNTQGSFICEPCPPGYSGNGFVCSDINECMLNNGGCSVSPFVKCTNSQGFYSCGACPTGFSGDGRTCTLTSACANHDCNSMARCVETPGIGIGRRCECMDGWIGNGIGINGCTSNAQGGVSTFNMCSLNPCRDGTCIRTSSGYSCECPQGRAGTNCEILVQACQSSPCLNLGTCIEGGNGSYICDCPNNFTGDRCQTAQSDCGGELSGISGELDFPRGSVNYGPNLLCTWYIRSNDPTKIISMHFVLFELEDDTQCSYDRLTIYDSGIVSVNQISEACGRSLNGKTVNTTGPVATLKLVTDHMDHEAGFKIHWSSIKPMCGAVVRNASSGVIKSPGYPFNYAHNLSCTWILEGAPGTHFKLQFDSMKIEYHYSCDYDILVVRNGLTEESPIIKKFCQSTPPEYILSFGPAVYLHFKTDDSESDKGFLIRYTSHNSSTCGGTLTSESGVISTPGYPSPFRSRLDCAWVIAPTNQIIDLVFTDFDLSADCEHNYLEIRKGYDAFSPLLGKYCDGNIPAPLRVYTSNLFISVKTDDSTTVGGFRSEWKTECTNIFTDQVGFIQSHGFPSNYPPNQNCTYKVEAESNTLIVIELKVFRLQNRVSGECKDYLLIIEGGRQNKLCGTQVTRSYTYRGPVVLNFVSDELQESNGFYITYMKYNNTNIGGDDVDDEDSSGNFRCGGTLTQDVGHINTGDNMLSHELDCTWIIEVSQNHIIALIFRVLDLEFSEECSFDYVKVYDDKEKEKLLGNYCGKAIPPRLNSTNNVLLIHLHTDHSELSAGFKIVYYSIDASKYCDKTFTQNSGIITSPGYPNSYERKTCVWLIKADPNKIITLNFTKFNVEDSYQCRYDYLEIRNGEYATSPLIGKYCGNEIPQNITSHTNFLYLKFVTDDDTEAEGFVIHFDSTTQGCGGTLSGESGHFTSPNYPAVPFGVAECQWKIIVSKGSKVKLRFIDFEVGHSPCDSSYVKVHNLELTPTEETLCGRIPNKLFTSEENEMLITFRSTSRFNQKGFMASYYQDCNVELSESEGVIESPNYPDTYGLGLECKWHIKGSLKSQIKLEIVELKFNYQSSCDDYIEISSNDRTQKVCEDTNDWHLNAGEKNITIKFVSAKEHRGLGVSNARFKIKYSVEGCGEKISLPSGFLTSPNYPDHYHSTDQCHWVIQVDPSKRINITIHDIDLESHESCDHDYLKIYNGANDKSKIITTLCHKQENEQIFTSLGNTVFIDFLSDYSVNGKGFNISWKTVPNNICGNYLTLESANITSPNYPQSYPHHMDCKWFIKTELGTRIKLKITDLDIEASFDDCGYDSLRIYEDHGTTKLIRSPLCGHFLELPIIITSESNYMTIWMTTDADTSHKGFAATYTTECGSTFKVTRGEMESLSSPNYPNLYKANLNCTWTITNTALDEKVTIVVSHFNLESSDNCTYDFLSIQEGESLNSPLVGKYCGNQAPAHYTSTGSSVTLNFVTDRSHENFGFKLFYTGSTSVCGLEYKSQAGTINSPNFPYVYPNNHQCIWNITAPAGNKIEISFLDFSLHGGSSCTGDKLFIRWLNESEELCSTMPLATKVYDASALMLLFQSDDSGQSTGFSLNYKTVYGGHLANWQEGAIESPNYPGLYGPNQDIVWLLTPPNSQTIRFIFESFDLENPYMDNCYDYVQISSGVDVFEKICGSAIPSPVITLKSPIKIRFVSDSADFFRGFRLTWKADELLPTETKHITFSPPLCGGEIVLDASSNVTIMIENDRNFINNNCTWVVDSLSGFVKFTIESLNIVSSEDSCPYGYLKIVDGSGTDLDKILCGSSSFYRNKEYVVHSSKAFLIYKHNPLQGFKLWATSTCDRSFEHDSGAITSPNYSLNYPVNMNCTYFIKISEWESISLTFHDIDIACDVSATDKGDYLEIYDGPITGRKIRTECGTNLPLPISSSSNQLTLRFISNGDNRVGKGFKAIYMPQTEGCGSKFELSDDIPNFTINSPNYPNLYNSSSDCVWVITTEGNDLITATFSGTFNIHEKEGLLCHKDKIIIRDGYDSQSPLIGIYCGNVRPEPITSTGTSLYLRFISDLSVDASGFKLDLKKGVCGGKYVQSQGTIVSPRYPQNYPENQLCNWVIEVPLNHYITLTFEDLDIQDCNDKLVFRDFNATGPIISEVCTSKVHLTSASNVLLIKFVSDNYRNSKGFKMNYISSSEACGGEQSMPYGVITSPNYPHPLNRKRVCEWIIKAPLGKRVEINITDFDLENIDCSANYLMVQGGMFPDSPVYTNSCRLYNNRNFSSDYNIMKIKFSTTGHGKGFSLNYNTLENDRCNRGWNKENKIIILAAYDTFHTTECSFKIDFPSHSRQKSINFNSKNTISYGFVKFLEYPSNRLLHKVSSFETFPPLGIVSPSSAVIVQISLNHRENVTIRYAFTECGGLITQEGIIDSSDYPLEGSAGLGCAWLITAPDHNIIKVEKVGSNNEDLSCDEVNVELKNGIEMDSPSLFRTCKIDDKDYTIQSNYARLTLYSKKTAMKKLGVRFRIVFKAKGCGGWYHNKEGLIQALNWPLALHEDPVFCKWYIRVPIGYHIVASFQKPFNVSCSDQLEISSPFWNTTKFCENNKLDNISVFTNEMEILLNSDKNSPGFGLEYKSVCGMNHTKFQGTLTTPNYPQKYFSNESCIHHLNIPNTYQIVLNVETRTSFYTDYYYYYGRHSYSRRRYVGQFCDENYIEIDPLNSTSSKIKLCSYSYSLRKSFVLQAPVSIIIKPSSQSSVQSAASIEYLVIRCNQTFTEEYGKIANYIKYSLDSAFECNWNIHMNDSRMIIRFRYLTGGCSASLKIYDKYANNRTEIPQSCEYDELNNYIYSQTNEVDIKYRQGFSRYGNAHFELEYQGIYKCGGEINESRGEIKAFQKVPSDVAFYEPNLNCKWTLITSSNHVFNIHWDRMLLAHTDLECPDHLDIFDNIYSDTPTIRICQNITYYNFLSASNKVIINFVSDDFGENVAMKATFTTETRTCGGYIRLSSGETKTLSKPAHSTRTRFVRCQWTIEAPRGETIQVDATEFDLDSNGTCSNAYLHFADKMITKTQKYCGSHLPHQFLSSDNIIVITYFAQDFRTNTRSKFNLSYKVHECRHNLTYPGGYVNRESSCNFTIKAPIGYEITLDFESFSLSYNGNCRNFLKIQYLSNGNTTSDLNCYSRQVSKRIPTNEVTVEYQNAGQYPLIGFTYTMYPKEQECGGVIKASKGIILQPEYPNSPNRSYNCTWTIMNWKPFTMKVFLRTYGSRYDSSCETSKSYVKINTGTSEICQTAYFEEYESRSEFGEYNITVNYVAVANNTNKNFRLTFQQINENQDKIDTPING